MLDFVTGLLTSRRFASKLFTKPKRTWLLCLLLLGTASSVGGATQTVQVSFSVQTNDPKQEGKDGKDKNKGQDESQNDEAPSQGNDKDSQAKDTNKNSTDKKDANKKEPKASNKTTTKKLKDDQPQTGTAEATADAGVAAGKGVLPNPVDRTSSGGGRYFVGEVSVNDGSSVLIGGTRLEGDLRWLSVLRAGMWAEAYGHWEDDVFVADDVVVREDNDWAYYRGPAAALGGDAQGTVEAWTADGKEAFENVRTAPDDGNAVRLVAYFDGQGLVAVPQDFSPPLTGGTAGWLELKGYFDGEKVVWESAAPFP